MKQYLKLGFMAALAVVFADQAFANPCPPGNPPTNCAPPAGAILDLNGSPIPPYLYAIQRPLHCVG